MSRARIAVLAAFSELLLVALLPASSSAWAPAGSATIHPGVQVFTAGGQCTANFVFEEGGAVYPGQAAHCAGTGGQSLQILPLAGSNGVGDLDKELAYARANGGFVGMQLAPGTEPFKPNLVGAIIGS